MTFICQKLNIATPTVIDGPPTGKRIISNLPNDWLRFFNYKVGYDWILKKSIYNKIKIK